MNVALFLSFKSFPGLRINSFRAITFNYLVCVVTGILFSEVNLFQNLKISTASWIWIPIFMAAMFITTFYLLARTTQIYSVAIATVASKMSMVIPVIFSIYIFSFDIREFSILNYLGVIIALIAIILISIKNLHALFSMHFRDISIFFPVMVFLSGGLIDTMLNFVNRQHITENSRGFFVLFLFLIAFLIGLTILLLRKNLPTRRDIFGGIYLGIPNFFSVYFLLFALDDFNNNGAVIFPVLNIGTITLSSILAVLVFKEKFTINNLLGVGLAILSILLISYQDIYIYIK